MTYLIFLYGSAVCLSIFRPHFFVWKFCLSTKFNFSGHSAAFWLGTWTFMAQIFIFGSDIGSTIDVLNGENLFGAKTSEETSQLRVWEVCWISSSNSWSTMIVYCVRLGDYWEIVRYLFLGTELTILELIPDSFIFGAWNFVRSFILVLMNFGVYETLVLMSCSWATAKCLILSGNRSIYLWGL